MNNIRNNPVRVLLAVILFCSVILTGVMVSSTADGSSQRQAAWHVVLDNPITLDTRDFGPARAGGVRVWQIDKGFFPDNLQTVTVLVTSIPNGVQRGHWRVVGDSETRLTLAPGLANLSARPVITTVDIKVNRTFTDSFGNENFRIYYAPYFTAGLSHVKLDIVGGTGFGN